MKRVRTYASLLIHSESVSPEAVTERLGIEPSRSHARDVDHRHRPRRLWNFWSWSSQDRVGSTDELEHIKFVLDRFEGKHAALTELVERGCKVSMSIFMDVERGSSGGPELDLETIERLAKCRASIWWDIYEASDGEGD